MVSLRFCIDVRSENSFAYTPKEKRFERSPMMRTGVWGWCGPPRRRRRRDPSPTPSPPLPPQPPPVISLCPAPTMSKPPPLEDFAESLGEEAGLSDMDFSEVDDSDLPDLKPPRQPGPMVMDAASKKWIGNESDFDRFQHIVADIGNDESVNPDLSVFQISDVKLAQWHQNGTEHNTWFNEGTTGQGIDIRNLAQQFSSNVDRRKRPSSEQQDSQHRKRDTHTSNNLG